MVLYRIEKQKDHYKVYFPLSLTKLSVSSTYIENTPVDVVNHLMVMQALEAVPDIKEHMFKVMKFKRNK